MPEFRAGGYKLPSVCVGVYQLGEGLIRREARKIQSQNEMNGGVVCGTNFDWQL